MMAALYEAFLWFYCLPLHRIFFGVIVITFAFLWLREIFRQKLWWKLLMFVGLAAGVALILMQTVLGRETGGVIAAPELTPFHTYRAYMEEPFEEILRMNFMNTVLVYPAGLFFCEVLPKKWRFWRVVPVVLLLGALCAGIEYHQYAYTLGQAEIDDVIHNTLGALLGALAVLCPFPERTVRMLQSKLKKFLMDEIK